MDDDVQGLSDQNQDGLAEDVMSGLGVTSEQEDSASESEGASKSQTQDPLYVQKRLKQQKRAHDKEIRALHDKIDQLQAAQYQNSSEKTDNPYYSDGQPSDVDEHIQKAVSFALQHKEMEERKALQRKQQEHVLQQHQELQKHLDDVSDKYDDFEDVVRGKNVPFTEAMRDVALLLPKSGPGSAGEVFYKLGKNKAELERIASLHPLEQAREIVKLSHSLTIGPGEKSSSTNPMSTIGNIKDNPVRKTGSITDKTPVGEIRRQMRAKWK